MRKDEPRRDYCPVRRVMREEARNLILLVVIVAAATVLRKLL